MIKKDKKTKRFIKTLDDKLCNCCGKEFHPLNIKQKYCSNKCKGKESSEDKNGNWNGGKTKCKCLFCGSIIQTYTKGKNVHKFCSRKCASEWRSANLVGDKSPRWGSKMSETLKEKLIKINTGRVHSKEERKKRSLASIKRFDKIGRKQYKRSYHMRDYKYLKWRSDIFARDNWTCKTCGIRGCYLEVHHIKSWAQYPKERFTLDNGVTLCKECHKLTNNYKNKKCPK